MDEWQAVEYGGVSKPAPSFAGAYDPYWSVKHMLPRTRERALRIIIASLMESDLSTRELNELAESLSEYKFSRELADLLHETVVHLAKGETKREWQEHDLNSIAYHRIQRRKWPKRAVIEFIRRVAPEAIGRMRSEATVREIIDEFFRTASQREVEDFMEMLQASNKSDAYLRGIMGRD